MKILQTVFDIMDYGGIVNHVELLAKGFRELGHKTEFVMLRCSDREPYINKAETHITGTYTSEVAQNVNTISGWYGAKVMSYGSMAELGRLEYFFDKFDLVIHQLPVPKPDPEGFWKMLYQCGAPQIAIVHDAHFRTMYPHFIDIAKYLIGVSVTNPAGYHALEQFPGKRCFIGAPHIPARWDDLRPWRKRWPKFVSAHVWKSWKHMDRVLRALNYLGDDVSNVIGGDGIEARYMRSIDKCKPKYEGLWKQALKAGMDYRGLIPPALLAEEYANARVMVDMSYAKKFAELGNHFNRSTIEAYNYGCVPLCVTENMRDDTGIFTAGKHYLALPEHQSRSPRALAGAIEDAVHLPWQRAEDIVIRGRRLLAEHFDYRISASQFIKLAKGETKIGIYKKLETGKLTPEIKEARNELLRAHTGSA